VRALVVDDDAMNRELLRRMLVRLGWRVDDARDGRAALASCAEARYELILVDQMMPGLDGLTLARFIVDAYAKDGHRPCLLAVTGMLLEDGDRDVFDGVLAKPFVMEDLDSAIKAAALSRERSGQAASGD